MSNSLLYFSVLSPEHLKAVQLTGKSSMEGEKWLQMEMGGREQEERGKLSLRCCVHGILPESASAGAVETSVQTRKYMDVLEIDCCSANEHQVLSFRSPGAQRGWLRSGSVWGFAMAC